MGQAALLNFAPVADGDPQRPAGSCNLCGLPAIASFDLASDPATVTVRFASQASGGPLPPAAQGLSEISISGAAVAVGPVRLSSGTEALRGTVDPAAISPDPPPPPPPPAPAAGVAVESESEAGTGPDSAVRASTPEELLERYRVAKRRSVESEEAARALRKRIDGYRAQIAAAEQELASAESEASGAKVAAADLGQALRDAVERELEG